MNILFVNNDEKKTKEIEKYFEQTNLNITQIEFKKFNNNLEYYFINFDLMFIELIGSEQIKTNYIKKYKNYSNSLLVSIIYAFDNIDFHVLSKNLRLDSFDYLIQPINADTLINKIKLYTTKQSDREFENYKMSIKGNFLRSLEHQWKQPLNFISTNLLNLEVKSELDRLEHSDIEKTNKNIESAINKISDTISKFNSCFNSSNNKTHFSINSAIENNLDIIFHKISNNNIQFNKLSDNSDIEIFNYENEFSLNIILLLNILIEWSIKEKKENDEIIINFDSIKDASTNIISISLNKNLSFNSIINSYNVEFFVIKNLLKKMSMKYTSNLESNNTHIKITL